MLVVLLGLTPAALKAQIRVGAMGEARYAQSRDDKLGSVGSSTGTLFGGRALVGIGTHVEVAASVASGSLTADSAAADDADLARGEATVTILPVPYLGIRVGAERHTFTTLGGASVERWTSARVGGEGRFAFHGGLVAAVVRFDFYPTVSVAGIPKPNSAFGGASGLSFRSGIVTGSVLYELERYDFAASGGAPAWHAQMSYLVGTVGLILGKRH